MSTPLIFSPLHTGRLFFLKPGNCFLEEYYNLIYFDLTLFFQEHFSTFLFPKCVIMCSLEIPCWHFKKKEFRFGNMHDSSCCWEIRTWARVPWVVWVYCFNDWTRLFRQAGSTLAFRVEQIFTNSLEYTEHHLNSAIFLKLHIHCNTFLWKLICYSYFLLVLLT